MGQQIFDSNGTFTVPLGIYKVTICGCGAGGSGAGASRHSDNDAGGGYRGDILSDYSIDVIPEDTITVTIGIGGAAVGPIDWSGNSGGSSSFGSASMAGGLGGVYNLWAYAGNGAPHSSCGGTFNDGLAFDYVDNWVLGGEAGAFGSGGRAGSGISGVAGGIGAGGGGSIAGNSGAGGNGRIVVNWDDYIEDGGFLLNGTVIPEAITSGSVQVSAKDLTGADYSGPVKVLILNGTEVWREI